MLILFLLVFALLCFGVNAFPNHGVRFNLDQAGKAFLVAALMAYLFAGGIHG